MRLLLDTRTPLWRRADDARLPDPARAALADESTEVLVSAATALEIATKQRIGKLPPWPMPVGGFDALVAADGLGQLPVSAAHAWHAGSLARPHRDPFDRMLAAQAMLDRLTLVTRDPVFAELPISTLW